MHRLIRKRNGAESIVIDPAFKDLLLKSGSSKYEPKQTPWTTRFEYELLTSILAPIESDGPEDSEEFNLFEEYLTVSDDHEEDLSNRCSLSNMLEAWRIDVVSYLPILANFLQALLLFWLT